MSHNAVGQELPAEVFEPRPDPARLPANLTYAGIFNSKSAIVAALMPLPEVIDSKSIYIRCAFYTALLVLFLFGIGVIILSWLVSGNPAYYGTIGRAGMRASQIMFVFAAALLVLANKN